MLAHTFLAVSGSVGSAIGGVVGLLGRLGDIFFLVLRAVTADVGPAGVGLVSAAPDRPVQAVFDGMCAAENEVKESADFGEGQCDKRLMGGWRRFRLGRVCDRWCCGFTGSAW